MKTSFLLLVLVSSLLEFSSASNDPVTQFEKKLEEHFQSYLSNPREGVIKLGGGWVKEKYSMQEDYAYDVQKTNS